MTIMAMQEKVKSGVNSSIKPPNTNKDNTTITMEEFDEDDLRIKEIMEEAEKQAFIEINGLGDVLAGSRPSKVTRSGSGAGARMTRSGNNSDDEDDDNLMDLDLDQLLDKSKARAPSSSSERRKSPDNSRPKRTADDDDDDIYKSAQYATQSAFQFSQRPKRETARKTPYSFKLALERPSESRQQLLNTKHSAAVKMGIVKAESWKQGNRSVGSNDFVKKLIRERKKEIREGIGSEGVKQAIAYIEKSRQYMKEEDELFDSLSEGEANDKFAVESDDDDMSDDDLRALIKSSTHKRIKIEGRDEILARFDNAKTEIFKQLENEKDEEEGQEAQKALEIIERDRADGIAGMSTEKDLGVAERNFWEAAEWKLPIHTKKLNLKKPSGLVASLLDLQDSPNHVLLAQLLRDVRLIEGLADASVSPFVIWLVNQAMLNESQDLSLGAIVALERLLDDATCEILQVCIDSLISALRSLGMKDDIFPRMDVDKRVEVDKRMEVDKRTNVDSNDDHSRKITRKIKIEKMSNFLTICKKVGKSLTSSSIDCKPLLFCLFRIIVDPTFDFLRGEARKAVKTFIEASFANCQGITWDMEFQDDLCSYLRSKYPTTRLAYLQCLPLDSLRSRILARNVASRLITQKEKASNSKPQPYIIPDNFDLLLATLNRQDDSINPLWVAKGAGKAIFPQLEANIAILQYCFTDLLLQLCVLYKEKESVVASRKRVHDRLIAANLENLIAKDPILLPRLERVKKHSYKFRLFTDKRKAIQVEEMIKLLYLFNNRILESTNSGSRQASSGLAAQMTASESQIRAKDALQRNALLLMYTLEQFKLNFSEDDESRNKEQGKLDRYITSSKINASN